MIHNLDASNFRRTGLESYDPKLGYFPLNIYIS